MTDDPDTVDVATVETTKETAGPAATEIGAVEPKIVPSTLSVAVIDCVPAV